MARNASLAVCEGPLEAAQRLFIAENPGISPGAAEITQRLDFDGDGHNDAAVTFPSEGGSGGGDQRLFILFGACAHYVGKLFGRELVPLQRDADGNLMLEVEAYAGSTDWLEQHAKLNAHGMYSIFEERHCRASYGQLRQKCSSWQPQGQSQMP
jgi:hypothetical protein